MKVSKELKDLEEDARDHLLFVIKCSLEYDRGERGSMRFVTTSLRAFFKDNKRSGTKSILKHLKLISCKFIDIAGIGKPVSLGPMFGGSLGVHDYLPNLNIENKYWLSFDDWYKGLVLYNQNAYEFTRESLIKELGEKYVQHVDKNVSKDFYWLFKNVNDYVGWKSYAGGIRIIQANIVYSVLRMICHELIVSLKRNKHDIINYDELYFDKLKKIEPFKPFGKYDVKLLNQTDIKISFYCNRNGQSYKLPITDGYTLANHNQNVSNVKEYFNNITEEIISAKVYKAIKSKAKRGTLNFKVKEEINLEDEYFASVHIESQKYQIVESILMEFEFNVEIK